MKCSCWLTTGGYQQGRLCTKTKKLKLKHFVNFVNHHIGVKRIIMILIYYFKLTAMVLLRCFKILTFRFSPITEYTSMPWLVMYTISVLLENNKPIAFWVESPRTIIWWQICSLYYRFTYLVHTNPSIVEFFDLHDCEYSFFSSFFSVPLPKLSWITLWNWTFVLVLWTAILGVRKLDIKSMVKVNGA